MVEFSHRQPDPTVLITYIQTHPNALPADFDSPNFHPVKQEIKRLLNEDQFGLCAYCESQLAPDEGQIDHVKPKGGPHAHRDLTYTYENYAHSCCDEPKHGGQRKRSGLLPIEPGPGCNLRFSINTDGEIDATIDQTRSGRHEVRQTRDMLGLNHPSLVRNRREWIASSEEILRLDFDLFKQFIADKPFRFILARLVHSSQSTMTNC